MLHVLQTSAFIEIPTENELKSVRPETSLLVALAKNKTTTRQPFLVWATLRSMEISKIEFKSNV